MVKQLARKWFDIAGDAAFKVIPQPITVALGLKWLDRAQYAIFDPLNRGGQDCYAQDGLYTIHNDRFRYDPAFRAAYARGVKAGDGVDPRMEWRVHVALWAASIALRTPGEFVECGVNAGFIGSAIMHRLNWQTVNRNYYCIDTFNGPVLAQYCPEEADRGRLKAAEDALRNESYWTDLERVRANYSEWPNAIVVQGVVPDVLPALDIDHVAFLHLDMNCAYPERAALEFFWDRLSPGAVVLLDDYCYRDCDYQTRSIDEAARRMGAEVLSMPTGQGIIVK